MKTFALTIMAALFLCAVSINTAMAQLPTNPLQVYKDQAFGDQAVNTRDIHMRQTALVISASTENIAITSIVFGFGELPLTNLQLRNQQMQVGSTYGVVQAGQTLEMVISPQLVVPNNTTIYLSLFADIGLNTGSYQVITKCVYGYGVQTGNIYSTEGTPVYGSTIKVESRPDDPASYGDLIKFLDEAFHLDKMNIPLELIPKSYKPNLQTPAYVRAAVLGMPWSESDTDSSIEQEPARAGDISGVAYSLFGQNQRFDFDRGMDFFRQMGVDVDSIEAAVRGVSGFNLQHNDRISKGTLKIMLSKVRLHPVILIEASALVIGDTAKIPVRIYDSGYKLAAFSMDLSISRGSNTTVHGFHGDNGFTGSFNYRGYGGYDYRLGGINTRGALLLSGSVLGRLEMTADCPEMVHITVFNSVLSDPDGTEDLQAWSPKTLSLTFSKYDVNMNFRHTVGDAVRANWYLQREEKPVVKGLGDADGNDIFDGDDVMPNFRTAIGYGPGKTSPLTVKSDNTPEGTIALRTNSSDDELTVNVSFTGNLSGAERFTGKLCFDPTALEVKNVEYPGSALPEFNSFYIGNGSVALTRYDTLMAPGDLVKITFAKIGGDNSFSLLPLNGSYFRLAEKVHVEVDGVTSADFDDALPLIFSLQQNYPNPFNPMTAISFSLPEPSHLTIKVYNMLGEEVATLVDASKPAGNFEVMFNASDLPSGVYIYRLTAGEYTEARKMLLAR